MLCWLRGADAGRCWGAACCAVRDAAMRAVSACARRPRAHAQLRGTCGRWRQRRTATATRSRARLASGPSWSAAPAATPPTRASSPGFLHGSGGAGRRRRCSTRRQRAATPTWPGLRSGWRTPGQCADCSASPWPPAPRPEAWPCAGARLSTASNQCAACVIAPHCCSVTAFHDRSSAG